MREMTASGVATPDAPAPDTPLVGRAADWAQLLGARWRVILAFFLVMAFALAALMPMRDIDLPMHLALGEWIVRHHRVPFTEPFAWTRMGAPYFAYSWLAEIGAYLALAALGPLGVHIMYAVVVTAAVLAVMLLGRLEEWRPWPTLLVAMLHFLVLTRITPSMRPQVALWALVPFAWVAAAWLRRSASPTRPLVLLFVVSALAANTHILFPLTAAPVFVLLADYSSLADRRRAWLAVIAVGAGWLATPYALAWPAVFRLNFAPNPLFRTPSPIVEYQPGFAANIVEGTFLAALPWLVRPAHTPAVRRHRLALGALWLVGLIAFALAEKGITVWWLVSLPLIGGALSRIPNPRTLGRARALVGVLATLALLMLLEHAVVGRPLRAEEGTVATRVMGSTEADAVEPLARWLTHHAHPARRARLFTTFSYGSYLTWRLPMYSASIDSRTIFPDSVALPESMVQRPLARVELGPWRDADVAIVPLRYPVAAVLDTAATWERLESAETGAARNLPLGLWARRAWWDSVRVEPAR